MNIYDFDDTIFDGDSSVCFIKYSLVHHPFIVLWCFIKAFKEYIKYLFKKSSIGLIKSELFSFVKYIHDFEIYINNFVLKYHLKVKDYYLTNFLENDVIISASFDFIVIPLCETLNISNVIATKYDVIHGKIIGENCKGKEKVRRFSEIYKVDDVNKAYSDSLSDIPMFEIAKKAFLVKGKNVIPYNKP